MRRRKKLRTGIFLSVWIVALHLGPPVEPEQGVLAQAPESGGSFEALSAGTTAYLPILTNKFSSQTVFGVQMTTIVPGPVLALVRNANTYWMRKNALLWSAVQPSQGSPYLWNNVASLEFEMSNAQTATSETILVIRGTPGWAQLVPGFPCGPMQPQFLPDFANFVAAAVQRYSAPPFNVRYFEIWNEPDVDPKLLNSPTEPYGCWGDETDPYYGGRYFGDMLQVVYPALKAANSSAQLISGGLLLGCDPRVDPVLCHPAKFFEGMLESGAKDAFDIAGFHGYDYYNPTLDTFGSPGWASGQFNGEPNGLLRPVFINKVQYLRELLDAYGIPEKPVFNTEGALICGGPLDPPGGPGCEALDTSPYEIMKAAYLAQSYAASIGENIMGDIWFSVEGWRNSGLVYPDGTPRPAFFVFKFGQQMLAGAERRRTVTEYNDVTGYVFDRGQGPEIWVLWADDGGFQQVSLPFTPSAIWDLQGNPLPVNGGNISLSIEPVYIQAP